MFVRLCLLTALLALLCACAATRGLHGAHVDVRLSATAEVNPDIEGRPSPIAVKLYELSRRAEFDSLDFEAAFTRSEALLGDTLLSASEHILLPGQTLERRIELHPATAHVAVVAAYRAIDEAHWKLVYPVNSNWFQSRKVSLRADGLVRVE